MRRLFALAAAFVVATFQLSSAPPPRYGWFASVDTLKVNVHLDTVLVRENVTLTARTVDSVGRAKNVPIIWTIRNSALFRGIRQTGTYNTHFSAFAKSDTGRTYIVATNSSNSKKDSALVIVRDTVCVPGTLSTVKTRPDSMVLRFKDTVGVTLLARDNCGSLIPGGTDVTWASTNTGKATVSSADSLTGKVIAVDSTGTFYIRGTVGTTKDSVKVRLRGNPGS